MIVFKTLYSKLAVTLFAVICLIGVALFMLVRWSSEMYQQELAQKLNHDLARNLVSESALLNQRRINRAALQDVFHALMLINPSIEVYLLDPTGRILAYSAPHEKIKRMRVAMGPIRGFLGGAMDYPILGDDPRNPAGRKVFSVAPVRADGRVEGYLYVILGGQQYDNVTQMLRGSYILRIGAWGIGASLLAALAAGLLLFALLTRRLRRLSGAIQSFSDGHYDDASARYAVGDGRGDEIDRLGHHFNVMADRIQSQLEVLRQNDTQRRELVANVSHDLRTPLASLHGYLETLLIKGNELSEEERKRYLEIAASHSEQLAKLVEELFELAKLDACAQPLHSEVFSLGELLQDVAVKSQLLAERKGVRIETDIQRDLPFVRGDIGMIQRVLDNLIENAVRHTPGGGRIIVAAHEQSGRIGVRVTDTGCGIPPSELPHIFDRFYRLQKSRIEGSGNAGLGLAIAKRILELHGSRIAADSEPDVGTTIRFDLPARAAG